MPECDDTILKITEDTLLVYENGEPETVESELGLDDGNWHRLIITYDGDELQLSLDGSTRSATEITVLTPEL